MWRSQPPHICGRPSPGGRLGTPRGSKLGRRGRGCESLPSRFFVLHPPAKKLAWRPISACLHIPWAIFHFFRKRNPHPKSCQSPSNTLSCERYTASPVCASVVANAFSCILSPYTMAPHAAVRLGLPARRQKKRTMIFPFSLTKVIRSLSLYSPALRKAGWVFELLLTFHPDIDLSQQPAIRFGCN